jgi:hypothetical protein
MAKAKRPKRAWNSRTILWPCKDCGCEIQPVRRGHRFTWHVSDKLWNSAGAKPGELLCMGCFGKRIGRTLSFGDFVWSTGSYISRKEFRKECANVKATGNVFGICVGE